MRPHRALLLASCLALSGCNAVLGIDEPSDTVREVSGRDASSTYDDAGAVFDDASAAPAQGAGPLPPSPHARAAWPMPSSADAGLPYPQAYEVEPSGVVTDEVTKLVWQQNMEREPLNYEAASSYCEQLTLGDDKFRLPSRIELTSLLDLGQPSPAIDQSAFPEAVADKLWTSSPFAGAANQRWLVNFGFGTGLLFSAGVGEKHYVRCIRDDDLGRPPPENQLEVVGETVRDHATQLTWQRAVASEMTTAIESGTACASLKLAGGGFRLPTIKELHTLVDEGRFKTAIDPEAFPDTPSAYFWTSSKVAGFNQYTWMVSFTDGSDRWVAAEVTGQVRCVRQEGAP